jgi:Ca2+-binding EF-hand superfamily protein
MDANQNGYLEFEEMSENLQAEKDKWDVDKDGLIDMDEFREYIKAWQEKRQAEREEGGRSGNSDGGRNSDDRRGTLPPGGAGDDHPPVDLDKKVAVLRAGKLGDKMPSWFTEHDSDKDAQVALWEWKEKNGELSEFRKWDLNGDGFITPDEVLRVNAVASKDNAPSSSSPSGDSLTTSTGGSPRPGGATGAGAATTGNWLAQMFAGRRGGQGGGAAAAPPGGGFGRSGFGGGGNSADTTFERYARGRSSFNISEAGQLKASLTEYAQKKGLSDGMITKEQFRDYWAQRESERGSGSGGPGAPGGRGSRGGRPR